MPMVAACAGASRELHVGYCLDVAAELARRLGYGPRHYPGLANIRANIQTLQSLVLTARVSRRVHLLQTMTAYLITLHRSRTPVLVGTAWSRHACRQVAILAEFRNHSRHCLQNLAHDRYVGAVIDKMTHNDRDDLRRREAAMTLLRLRRRHVSSAVKSRTGRLT